MRVDWELQPRDEPYALIYFINLVISNTFVLEIKSLMKKSSQEKSPLLIIFLVVFIDLVGFGIMIPILPYYAKQFGASALTLGILMSSYSAMQFLFAPIWGGISDRIGRRPVVLISLLGSVISLTILGFAQSIGWLLAGRIFSGICGANISTASAYIADITTPENRAKGMGLIGAGFGLGFIFGPAIGGILSVYGYGVPMFFAAFVAALDLVFAYFALPEPKKHEESFSAKRKYIDRNLLRELFQKDPRSVLAIFIFAIITLAFTQIEVSFALYMLAKFDFDAKHAGYFLALMGLIGASVQGGAIGKLSRKFGESNLILFGTGLMCISLIGFVSANQLSSVTICILFLAFGNALNNPSLSSLASKGAPNNKRGATMGVFHSFASLSRILGPIFGGFLFDHFGKNAPFSSAAIIYGIICFSLIFMTQSGIFGLRSKAD